MLNVILKDKLQKLSEVWNGFNSNFITEDSLNLFVL